MKTSPEIEHGPLRLCFSFRNFKVDGTDETSDDLEAKHGVSSITYFSMNLCHDIQLKQNKPKLENGSRMTLTLTYALKKVKQQERVSNHFQETNGEKTNDH